MFKNKLFGGVLLILFFSNEVSSLSSYSNSKSDQKLLSVGGGEEGKVEDLILRDDLNEVERQQANEARYVIAQVMEKNLIKLFTIIVAKNDNHRSPRQDEDDVAEAATVLPQVAQILGAIFAGNINLTSVVDQAVWLVPTALRLQAEGMVRLLTGNSLAAFFYITTPRPAVRITAQPVRITEPPATIKEIPVEIVTEPVVVVPVEIPTTQKACIDCRKGPYRVKQKVRTRSLRPAELSRYERVLVRRAISFEPLVKNQDPMKFITMLGKLFSRVDFSMPEIVKQVPSIFNGGQDALKILETFRKMF